MSIHADALEQSQGLYVRKYLVPDEYKQAVANGAVELSGLVAVAKHSGWAG